MHSSLVDENSDGTGQMEKKPGNPLLSCGSMDSDDVSESLRLFPRIGDKYQVHVAPYKPHVDYYQLAMTAGMNCQDNKNEDIEKKFEEALALPVMRITYLPSLVGIKYYGKTNVSGPLPEDRLETKECLSAVTVQTHGGLQQQILFQSADEDHANELSDNYQLTEDKGNTSLTNSKANISRTKDTCTESIVAKENMPCAFYSYGRKKRKWGRSSWKKVKKNKADFLDSNFQTQDPITCNRGNHANLRSCVIVPGSQSVPWSKIEKDLFIMGLYIFGKNLNAVKKFLETKEMGDIISYYYGIFFRTESYCRWTASRKKGSRKCIQGQRIFSGWRQQELLTRLLPHMSEYSKHKVLEITRSFNEGRTSLEEFVTKLKELSGPDVLFQAVGIGKDKEDLTSGLVEPAKTNGILSSHFEISVGRACSSLSTNDIVNFLTGDFRLSKAWAKDLFWKAVWPRLLGRGWHSEEPENQVRFGSRQSVVFLIPGVQKFARRELSKGIHYFDSVSEVLSRVASDPRLLEVENGHADHSLCYLQPRNCTNNSESLMFTVVDSSLTSRDEQPHRIRRRVALPLDDDTAISQTVSLEIEAESNLPPQVTEQQCGKCCVPGDLLNNNQEELTSIVIKVEDLDDKIMQFGTHKALVSDQNDVVFSPSKQSRLNICNEHKNDAIGASVIESSGSRIQQCMLKCYCKDKESEASLGANSLEKCISISSSTERSPERSFDTTCLNTESLFLNSICNTSHKSRECEMIFDTGLGSKSLQDQTESTAMNSLFGTGSKPLNGSKIEENSHYKTAIECLNEEPNKKSGFVRTLPTDSDDCQSAEPQENNASELKADVFTVRRQSSRVRPLTAKAREAFANGFFTLKRRKKGGEKTLNSDGHRTKSLSKLVQDEVSSSFNG